MSAHNPKSHSLMMPASGRPLPQVAGEPRTCARPFSGFKCLGAMPHCREPGGSGPSTTANRDCPAVAVPKRSEWPQNREKKPGHHDRLGKAATGWPSEIQDTELHEHVFRFYVARRPR